MLTCSLQAMMCGRKYHGTLVPHSLLIHTVPDSGPLMIYFLKGCVKANEGCNICVSSMSLHVRKTKNSKNFLQVSSLLDCLLLYQSSGECSNSKNDNIT